MKILVVQETDWITRYPHTQHHLFERLSLKGHTIHVIDYDFDWKKDPERKVLKKREVFSSVSKIHAGSSIEVIRPPSVHIPVLEYGYLMIYHYQELSRQVREFRPDVIVGFGILNAYLASKIAQRNNIPFIYYWIDALDTLIPEKYFQILGRYIEKKTLHNSRKIYVTNEKLIDHLAELGANTDLIEIFSSGIDLVKFNPQINGKEIRLKYRIADNQIVLLFMGWIYHFSGMKEVAIELAKKRENYANIVLLVVGEGDAYLDMIRIQEEFNMGDQLILTGKQPYPLIPEFIGASDICILPAYPDERIMQDIVPIKLFEYMAVGKPVITTKLSGIIREFGIDNGIEYVDTPEDTLPKAKEITTANFLQEYGNQAHHLVEGKDWNVITNEFERSLKKVIHVR